MREFDLTKLGKMKYIVVEDSDGELVELPYTALKLVVVNGQLCFSCGVLQGEDIDLIMPIARQATINKLFSNEE